MAGTTTYFGISYPQSTDLVKDGAANMQTIATGFDSAVAIPTYNNQTGTTYTFALSDIGKTVTASNAGASTYTIPPTASVTWPSNTTLDVVNLGAGVVTFAAGAGVTVTNTAATLAQYQSAQLVRTGLNAWTVIKAGGSASGLTLVSATTIGTTVSSVTVSSCFSATYDNYKIIISGGVASTANDFRIQLSGITTSVYYNSLIYNVYGTSTIAISQNNSAFFSFCGNGVTTGIYGEVDLNSPFLTRPKTLRSFFNSISSTGIAGPVHNLCDTALSATGFTFTTASGTVTGGSIRVYGYQNS